MEKKELKPWLIWTAIIIGILAVLVGIESYRQNEKIDYKEIVALIVGSFTLFAIFITYIVSRNSNKDLTGVKKDISTLKDNDEFLNKKITGLNARFLSLEDQNGAYSDALKDIKSGLAEKEERQYYIYEAIKHKNDILSLCKKIKASTSNLIDEKYNLNADIKSFLIEKVDKFTDVVRVLYETGFEEFKPKYFLTSLLNTLDSSLKNSILFSTVKDEIKREMKKRIKNYVDQVNIILANNDNGERRKRFIEFTLQFQDQSTNLMLNIYTELNKQIA